MCWMISGRVSYEGPEIHTALSMLADSAQFLSLPERTGIWMEGNDGLISRNAAANHTDSEE